MLGALAQKLLLAGHDCSFFSNISDNRLVRHAIDEDRVLLTRDHDLTQRSNDLLTTEYISSEDPETQLKNIVDRYQLHIDRTTLLSRCTHCNRKLRRVAKREVEDSIPGETSRWIDQYTECPECGQIYWKGSHYEDIQEKFSKLNILQKSKNVPEQDENRL